MINLRYGTPFDENVLIAYIRENSRDYIIQGQQACLFEMHTKPSSLDYWLRENYANNRNIKQAENSVLDALVSTGKFAIEEDLPCPDSGRRCKGIRLSN
jgi:hypothetical protein